ncbi:hypothetical protein [Necropsobacter rosorum]|uniref:hypothetical protein n=1 Tax=Necropsobacter rosorum TaxID=908285 RepID=UPI003C7AAB78
MGTTAKSRKLELLIISYLNVFLEIETELNCKNTILKLRQTVFLLSTLSTPCISVITGG